ncbi:hypothetical protein CR513_26261, partial [Mucuna pruriens]
MDGIDYQVTLSPVSKKDSLRVVLALVTYYDLELHQMDVKTAFLNCDLEEEVYMDQLEKFISTTKKSYDFLENTIYQCIYMKVSGSRFVILVLYIGDILFATNDVAMLHDVKKFFSNKFEMKDMGEASYVLERFIKDKFSVGIVPIQKGDKFSQMQCPRNDLE